jgi:uncharacterized protein YgbK (DUF1537 family)
MRRHPVTPMTEADVRIHLAAQGLANLELVPFTMLDDTDAVAKALRKGPVLFDVTSVNDHIKIAAALRATSGRQLLIGASSVAEILTEGCGGPVEAPAPAMPASDNVLIFAGSRSATTQKQVEDARSYCKLPFAPAALRSDALVSSAAALLRQGKPVLVHLSPEADYGLSSDVLATASSVFVKRLLDRVEVGYLGLAGGDTSSRICAELGFASISYLENIDPGVSLCIGTHPEARLNNMRIILKGGQMGGPDLFERFLRRSSMSGR